MSICRSVCQSTLRQSSGPWIARYNPHQYSTFTRAKTSQNTIRKDDRWQKPRSGNVVHKHRKTDCPRPLINEEDDQPDSRNSMRKKIRFVGSHGSTYNAQGDQTIPRICSTKIATLPYADLENLDTKSRLSITSGELICSYSWDDEAKQLYVPGAPPRFDPPRLPIEDNASVETTVTIRTLPNLELLPHIWRAVEALHVTQSTFQFSDVDLVCSTKALDTLFQFCDTGKTFPGIIMRMVEDTLVLETPISQNVTGYTFGKILTTAEHEVLKSTTHYRWNKYTIGPQNRRFRCAVYTEVDAHCDGSPKRKIPPTTPDYQPATYMEATSVARIGQDLKPSSVAAFKIADARPEYAKLFFSRITRLVKVYFTGWKMQAIRDCELVELRPGFYWKQGGHVMPKLEVLLSKLKDLTKKSKNKVCVAIGSGENDDFSKEVAIGVSKRDEKDSANAIEVYDPELSPSVLDRRGVKQALRVSLDFLPKHVTDTFWKKTTPDNRSSKKV